MGPVKLVLKMVTINELVEIASKVAGKLVHKLYSRCTNGVRGQLNNDLIREKLGWDYSQTLENYPKTYEWINGQANGTSYCVTVLPPN